MIECHPLLVPFHHVARLAHRAGHHVWHRAVGIHRHAPVHHVSAVAVPTHAPVAASTVCRAVAGLLAGAALLPPGSVLPPAAGIGGFPTGSPSEYGGIPGMASGYGLPEGEAAGGIQFAGPIGGAFLGSGPGYPGNGFAGTGPAAAYPGTTFASLLPAAAVPSLGAGLPGGSTTATLPYHPFDYGPVGTESPPGDATAASGPTVSGRNTPGTPTTIMYGTGGPDYGTPVPEPRTATLVLSGCLILAACKVSAMLRRSRRASLGKQADRRGVALS